MAESMDSSPLAQPLSVMENVRFWLQMLGDMKRTVIVPPEHEEGVKQKMAEHKIGSHITIVASPACPPNTFLVIDQQAMKADFTRPRKFPPLGDRTPDPETKICLACQKVPARAGDFMCTSCRYSL